MSTNSGHRRENTMEYTVSKSIIGKQFVSYRCGQCGTSLESPLEDAGKADTCPQCSFAFTVPGVVELEQQKRAEAERHRKKREEQEHKQKHDAALAETARNAEGILRRQQIEQAQQGPAEPAAPAGNGGLMSQVIFGVGVVSVLCSLPVFGLIVRHFTSASNLAYSGITVESLGLVMSIGFAISLGLILLFVGLLFCWMGRVRVGSDRLKPAAEPRTAPADDPGRFRVVGVNPGGYEVSMQIQAACAANARAMAAAKGIRVGLVQLENI